jgi:tripartite-type tricarboxylate transporter receptor subunit TctC
MLKSPEVRAQLANLGGEASPSSPDQMRDRITGEMVRWKRVMEIRKISPN